jgi:hypothetical protein
MSKRIYEVVSIDACNAGSNTTIIVKPTFVGNLESFSVTCITSATIAVNYSIQLSPFQDEGFATAGANYTATSVPAASGADQVVSNKILNNTHAYMRIEASANSNVAVADLRFHIHGIRF